MTELDEIKKRKFEELMQHQQEKLQYQAQEQAQLQQQIDAIESIVKQFLTKEALTRYGNLKIGHRDKALKLLVVLYQAIQKGQIQGMIDDLTLKKILGQLTPKQREIKIKRV